MACAFRKTILCSFLRMGNNPAVADKEKYPTAMTTSPFSNSVFVIFVRRFLLSFKWSTVYMICDKAASQMAYYQTNCGNLQRELTAPYFQLTTLSFNSNEKVNYDRLLAYVAVSTRGAFELFMCSPDT